MSRISLCRKKFDFKLKTLNRSVSDNQMASFIDHRIFFQDFILFVPYHHLNLILRKAFEKCLRLIPPNRNFNVYMLTSFSANKKI
ncbi:hypothetical protein D3C87_1588690 [compost metagenome]